MTRSSIAASFLVLLSAVCAGSAAPSPAEKEIVSFEHIPAPNFGVINCVIRDDRGFLWFGTSKGLFKYDGYQIRVLTVGDEEPLQGNILGRDRQVVTAMARMEDGSLLLGTDLGLWQFDPETGKFRPFCSDRELSTTRISSVAEDLHHTFWIGTASRGLYRLDPTTCTVSRLPSSAGLDDIRITALLAGRSDTVWVGTVGGGVYGLDISLPSPGVVTHLHRVPGSNSPGLPSDEIAALCTNSGELWIGTNRGLAVFHLRTAVVSTIGLASPIPNTVQSIVADPSGRMWIAASDIGVLSCREGAAMQFTSSGDLDRSLRSAKVLYADPVASDEATLLLWVGTRDGIDKIVISRNPFHCYIRGEDSLELNRGAVLSMCEDHRGVLWVGLWGGGLVGFNRAGGAYRAGGSLTYTSKSPLALPNDDINSVAEDRDGNLWIGTASGLVMLDSTRHHLLLDRHRADDPSSLLSDAVGRITADRSGNVWCCTDEGLSRLIPGPVHRFRNFLSGETDRRKFGGNVVSDVMEDRWGNIWAATYGRGLNRFEPDGSVTRFLCPADTAGDEENFIYTIVENDEGSFWLSTRAGLVLFDLRTGSFVRHPIAQLHDAHIFDIRPDPRGGLWLSTSVGLVKFDSATGAFTRFGSEHGLKFSELFSEFCPTRSGSVLVGGIDGFAEFSFHDIGRKARIPKLAITSFQVLDREISAPVSGPEPVRLSYDQNFLSFSFAVLDYANPRRNRFMIRMDGVDARWVDAGTRNFATYPKLEPGSYRFEVRGCNSENVWDEGAASVSIMISPPFWHAWWFRLLIAGILLAVVSAAYRYRLGRALEVERLRLRIADDLHDDVGSNLSSIAMRSRSLQRAPELSTATRQKLAEIYETAITTSQGMKDIVWFIKPRSDTVDDLLLRMKDAASAILCDVEHNFETTGGDNSVRVSIEFRRAFFLACKEALTNVAKHARATKVQITVRHADGMLEMVIHDNGIGFDSDGAGRNGLAGNGLSSLRQRAGSLAGGFQISSERGRGTTVRFSGKIRT